VLINLSPVNLKGDQLLLAGITRIPGELDLLGNLDKCRRLMMTESRPFRHDTLKDVQELSACPGKIDNLVHKGKGSEHISLGDISCRDGCPNRTGVDEGSIDFATSILPVFVHGVRDDISEGA
jgi:hypothetical protein